MDLLEANGAAATVATSQAATALGYQVSIKLRESA